MKYITDKDFQKITAAAIAAAETVPAAHRRIREEEMNAAIMRGISAAPSRTPGKISAIVYRHDVNVGTRKWPYMIDTAETETISKDCVLVETEKSYIVSVEKYGYRKVIKKENALAIVKG